MYFKKSGLSWDISSITTNVTTTISKVSYKVIKEINKIDFINPNVLIDIYIKFIIIATIFYILYKYFLIDISINNMYKLLNAKFDIYIPSVKKIKAKNKIIFDSINNFMINYSNKLKNLPKNKDSKINDTNTIIIFVTMILSLFIIIAGIIYFTNGYNNINFVNIGYSILFNLIFIILSQFILFYVIYSFIDPIKIYKFFYYDYYIKPVDDISSQTIKTIVNDNSILIPNNISSISLQTEKLKLIDTNNQPIIINSKKIAIIYIFTIIFICIFIFTLLLSIINYLIIYNNYKINSSIFPFTQLSLIIYILISCFSLIILIILLILLFNII